MPLVIAIDESLNAAVIIEARYEDLPRIRREFLPDKGSAWRIRHFRKELKNEPRWKKNAYLHQFIDRLREAERKFDLVYRFFPNIRSQRFWNYVRYLLGAETIELIIDDTLYKNYHWFFDDAQISIVTEGRVSDSINRLENEIRKAKKSKDVTRVKELEKELEWYKQRWVLITIADNYIHYKRRKNELNCSRKRR